MLSPRQKSKPSRCWSFSVTDVIVPGRAVEETRSQADRLATVLRRHRGDGSVPATTGLGQLERVLIVRATKKLLDRIGPPGSQSLSCQRALMVEYLPLAGCGAPPERGAVGSPATVFGDVFQHDQAVG
jgi:hypothetical protein